MILECFDKLSDRIYRAFGRRNPFPDLAKRNGDDFAVLHQKGSGIYRTVLFWQEQSILFQVKQRIFQAFLKSSVSDVGLFLILGGVIGLAGNLLLRHAGVLSAEVLIPLIQILSASILLRSPQNCAQCMRKSLFFRWLLFDFCGLSDTPFHVRPWGRSGRWGWILLGICLGGIEMFGSPVLAAVLLLGTALAVLLFSVPELAILAVLGGLPFLNLFSRPTALLLALLVVCVTVGAGKAISGKRQMEWGLIDGLMLWMGGLFAFGGLISHGDLAEGLVRSFLLLSAWFSVRLLLNHSPWRERAFCVMILSSLICALWGIGQYVMGKAELKWVDVSRFGDIGGRVCGFFGNPNLFAIFLLYSIPLCLGMCFQSKTVLKKWLFFLSFLAGSLCLVLTWSRGAWLAWMLGVILFLMLCSRRSLSVLMALGVCSVGLVSFLPANVMNRFRSIGNFADSSANYRIYTWRGVGRLLKAHPWGIGCGESAFRSVYPVYAVSGTESVMHSHQVFLDVFVELGIPGFLLFLTVLFCLLRGSLAFLIRTESGPARAAGVSLFCAFLGVLLMGCFDSLWYHHGLFWLFWCLCALLENANGKERV